MAMVVDLNSLRSGVGGHCVGRGSWRGQLEANHELVPPAWVSEQHEQQAEWIADVGDDVEDEPINEVTEPVGVLSLD